MLAIIQMEKLLPRFPIVQVLELTNQSPAGEKRIFGGWCHRPVKTKRALRRSYGVAWATVLINLVFSQSKFLC